MHKLIKFELPKLCILFLLHVLVESGQNQDKRNKEFACLKVNLEIF